MRDFLFPENIPRHHEVAHHFDAAAIRQEALDSIARQQAAAIPVAPLGLPAPVAPLGSPTPLSCRSPGLHLACFRMWRLRQMIICLLRYPLRVSQCLI
jgi:hypothetical protein